MRYSLFAIRRGTLKVDEVSIASPVMHILENADGTSNLDPLLMKEEAKPAAPPAPSPQEKLLGEIRDILRAK